MYYKTFIQQLLEMHVKTYSGCCHSFLCDIVRNRIVKNFAGSSEMDIHCISRAQNIRLQINQIFGVKKISSLSEKIFMWYLYKIIFAEHMLGISFKIISERQFK